METQSAVLQSLSTLRSTLNAWIRLCLVSAVKGFTSSKHSLETLRFHFISAADCSVTFAPSLYANLSHCRPPGNAATEQNTQVRRDRGDYKVHFPKTVLQVRTWSFKEGNCLSKDPSSSVLSTKSYDSNSRAARTVAWTHSGALSCCWAL